MGARLTARASRRAGAGAGRRATAVLLIAGAPLSGCGSRHRVPNVPGIPRALLSQARPIGSGTRFHPPPTGRLIEPCTPRLGPRSEVHVELFAANRVVLVPAGIGTRPPLRHLSGRIAGAGCYGALVTLDPTGLVLVSSGRRLTLSDLFGSWGQPLSSRRLAGFTAPHGNRVAVFVDGRRWQGSPGSVALTGRAEIVLEVGPYVVPHAAYTFPSAP